MQAAQRLLAHALFKHGGLIHQAGFGAGFDGLKVQQVGHEADWVQEGVQHVVCPGNQGMIAPVGRATRLPAKIKIGWRA